MKINPLYFNALFICLTTTSINAQSNFDLIPKPLNLEESNGFYHFNKLTTIYADKELEKIAELLEEHPAIDQLTIKSLGKTTAPKGSIIIQKATDKDALDKGSYSLQINSNGIFIKSWEKQTAINAVYTLIQLGYLQNDSSKIKFVNIIDQPRFSYRGLHLDVSRHFMPISFIKKYLDLMAIYKFNNFHWHLTDGAGWRLEIKKYPELTQKAAWRTHAIWKDWWNNGRQYVEKGSPNASGGFYTQEQAKEIVAYAAKKGINVIPEIEMPSHSEEVIATFPELKCEGDHQTQGEFCIGNEQTFVFLKNVIDEVLELFPSKYIHIGGDEADKSHWKKCPKDQSLIKQKGLKNVDELQSYAIQQMDEYLQSKGRKLIGWDEILEGGLTKGATVMSWRGEEGGIKAANAGHDVIMTPGSHLYFDSYQTDPRTQPENLGGFLTIDKVYSYDPIPSEILPDKSKHILGAQANLWAEFIPTTEHAEYMAFPRALALSEVNWTKKDLKSWNDFEKRLQSHYKLLQDLNVNYYRPSYNISYKAEYNANNHSNLVTLTTEQIDKTKIRYTRDGSTPTIHSDQYTKPFIVNQSKNIQAAYFLNDIQVGPTLNFQVDLHKAIGKPVTYISKWDGYAAQQEKTMTNGVMGSLTYHDKQWQGFTKPIELIVDLEEKTTIQTVAMYFMQITGPGVYMPGELEVLVSDDNKIYKSVGVVKNDVPITESKLTFKRFELKLTQPIKTKYVKVKASNPMNGYLFTDEIIIY